MSEELKSCPFCGGEALKSFHEEPLVCCIVPLCPGHERFVSIEAWNTRPIENSLRAKIEQIKAERNWLASRVAKKECDDYRNSWCDVTNPKFSQKYWLEQAAVAVEREK